MPHERPNILFLMDDQHRWDYLGCAAAGWVSTPNIDSIAARGTRFTTVTTNCPVCAPARIGLATGQNPFRLGSTSNASFLPLSRPTYYQRLRDHGYHVGLVGKLDLAKPAGYNGREGDRPCNYSFGFTHPVECEGKMHAGNSPEPQGPYGHWLEERGLYRQFHEDYRSRAAKGWIRGASHDSVLPADAFADVYIGRRAVEWLEAVSDEFPWHLFVSFVGPHDPFDPPQEYGRRYRDAEVPPAISGTLEGKPAWVRRRDLGLSAEEVAHTRRQYCASIEAIDDQIGLILQAVEGRGMAERTVVVYSSDHGELLGDHGLYTKSAPYEASVRVPLVVAGPGLPGGAVNDALVELIDVNPTLCELAGLPAQEGIDARSFAAALRGEAPEHREDTLSVIAGFASLRTRSHKLVHSVNDSPELYDLEADPEERHNLADREPELTRRLQRRLASRMMEDQWLR